MKLYDKKFLIYGNCMIRSFGQPGIQIYNSLFNTERENNGLNKLIQHLHKRRTFC